MELHEAPVNYFFKVWPWIEANKIRLGVGAGIVIVAAGVISFNSYRRAQREIDAGRALTQAMMADPRNNTVEKQSGQFMKIAGDYSGTAAGQRAILQSAAMLFNAQKFAEAQAQFQQFLGQYSGSTLAVQAALGVASCLDAQGKTAPATEAYQRVISSYADSPVAVHAKYRLAQIAEQQGKVTDALNLYEDIVRGNPNSPLGADAGMRVMELKMISPATTPTPAPAVPLKANP
jgi:predicted negative regulator of RcsB-dependent stress response